MQVKFVCLNNYLYFHIYIYIYNMNSKFAAKHFDFCHLPCVQLLQVTNKLLAGVRLAFRHWQGLKSPTNSNLATFVNNTVTLTPSLCRSRNLIGSILPGCHTFMVVLIVVVIATVHFGFHVHHQKNQSLLSLHVLSLSFVA